MKTKKGMASFYLVAFTTLLLGIVTMSFARVMISESKEALNSDLSQSAFDAALAGIEDAKTAILMYETCSTPNAPEQITIENSSTKNCEQIRKTMSEGLKNNSCDTVRKVINGDDKEGEVVISEDLDQAYTCVPISDNSATYRSTLNENTRSRIIDVGNRVTDSDNNPAYASIAGIELQWYTPEAELGLDSENVDYMSKKPMIAKNMYDDLGGNGLVPLGTKDQAVDSYPILNFELFQTNDNFKMAELDINNDNNNGTDHAMIMLYPDSSAEKNTRYQDGESGTFVSKDNLLEASNKSNAAVSKGVMPKKVSCEAKTGARCRATIEFPNPYRENEPRAQQTFMLRISLPYGIPGTDFSIKACTNISNNECTDYANFRGAQYIVDSTGRASTLYRRIIARIETTTSLIFPEYAVQTSGKSNPTIEKNFWVTENCWHTDGKGNSAKCANNGRNSTNFEKTNQ